MAESEVEKENGLQKDLNKLVSCCETWSMCLNGVKCKVMHCGKGNPRKLDGAATTQSYVKYLGVIISINGKTRDRADTEARKLLAILFYCIYVVNIGTTQ